MPRGQIPKHLQECVDLDPQFITLFAVFSKDAVYALTSSLAEITSINDTHSFEPIRYRVPLPYIKILWFSQYECMYAYASGDRVAWTPLNIPHIHNGVLSGCTLRGPAMEYNPRDPLGTIRDYSISYIQETDRRFWDIYPENHCGFCKNLNPEPFMKIWESKTIDYALERTVARCK